MRSGKSVPFFASLEPRRLLAVPAAINFQPAGAAVPGGYVVDSGSAFGNRGNDFQFGWDAAISSATRDRNASNSPDQRYDTLIHTQLSGSRKWEVAVPNGAYTVRLVAGDPGYFDSVYRFNLENVLALSATPTSSSRWIENTVTVNVADGRLTLTNASGSANNKIAFMTITPANQPPPPPPGNQSPYKGTPFAISNTSSTTIQFEDYDNGGEGVAYHDKDAQNIGGGYRSDGVDLKAVQNDSGAYYVGYTHAGEWTEYTINVAATGTYNLAIRYASAGTGGTFHLELDGANITGSISVPSTGGWQSWQTLTRNGVTLSAGQHVLRLALDSVGPTGAVGNFNYLTITPANTQPPPPPPPPPPATQTPYGGVAWSVPGTIQAENFDNGGQGVAYHDVDSANHGGAYRSTGVDIQTTTDAGGGYNVGYVRAGEWLEYTINVTQAGNYNLDLRIASANSGGTLHVEVDGVNRTGSITVPNTGGWQSWQTLTRTGISLSAGQHVVRIQFNSSPSGGGICNLNWLRFSPATTSNAFWTTGPSVPIQLGEVAAGIINNKMYLVGNGGMTMYVYDIPSNTWSTAAPRLNGADHHAAEVLGGKFYLIGGLNGSAGGKLQIYNPAANSWSHGADMPFAAGSSSTAVIGGMIYSAGGIVGSSTTNRLVRYNPANNTWTELAPMPQARNHAATATDGSKLYIFGGRGPGSGDSNTLANGFNTVQIYDPATNTWQSSATPGSTIAPLPQARGGMGKAVYYNGEFYVIGGETATGAGATSNNVYNRVDIYNPPTNTWRLGPAMPTARHGIFPVLVNRKIHIAAGGVVAGHSSSSVLEILNLA